MKKMVISLVLLALVVTYGLFLLPNLAYKNEIVKEGSFRSLEIGMEKSVVYQSLPSLLHQLGNDLMFFKRLEVNDVISEEIGAPQGVPILVQTRLHPNEYRLFEMNDYWVLYIDGNYNHSLAVRFCDHVLCEVVYHSQRFELP